MRSDHAQFDLAGRAVDVKRLGARRLWCGRKRADALDAPLTDLRDRQALSARHRAGARSIVERARLGRNGGGVEQGGVDDERGRAYDAHQIQCGRPVQRSGCRKRARSGNVSSANGIAAAVHTGFAGRWVCQPRMRVALVSFPLIAKGRPWFATRCALASTPLGCSMQPQPGRLKCCSRQHRRALRAGGDAGVGRRNPCRVRADLQCPLSDLDRARPAGHRLVFRTAHARDCARARRLRLRGADSSDGLISPSISASAVARSRPSTAR